MVKKYAVIEFKLRGEKLHGVFDSLVKAKTKQKTINKKITTGSFGADIFKLS